MKKLLLTVLSLSFLCLYSTAQEVIITGIVDGTLSGAQPRAVELYISGTVDLSGYTMQRAANDDVFDTDISLSGTYTDQFVYVVNQEQPFHDVFGTDGDFSNTIQNGNITGTGNDAFRIIQGTTVIDQVAPGGDPNLYQDSYMYRMDNTGPDGGWVSSNWDIPGNNELDGEDEAGHREKVPFGTYNGGNTGGGKTVMVVVGTNPAEPATNGNFTLTLSEASTAAVTVTYTLSGSATEGVDYTDVESGSITITIGETTADLAQNIIDDNIADPGETIIITLNTADNDYIVSSNTATLTIADNEAGPFTPIYTIQGSGNASPFDDQMETTQGIVTSVSFGTDQFEGFYIQDATGDGDDATSDGIFVYCEGNSFCNGISIGDEVQVSGTVDEFFELTEIKDITSINILSQNNPLPSPTDINLDGTAINFEQYEGMLVRFNQTLYVSDVFDAGRFGEILLSGENALIQSTQLIDPNDNPPAGTTTTGTSNSAAVNAQITANQNNQIKLDDGRTSQNPSGALLPFFFNSDNTIRRGSTVDNLTGIMNYTFSEYKVEPLSDGHPNQSQTFNYAPRPAFPDLGSPDVVISSFNVLNYFNGDGTGGGFPTARGANNVEELERQEDKLVAALSRMDADVVGLNELESDGIGTNSALQQLVNALNAEVGANTYAFIDDSSISHPDAIRNAIIYKPATVTPIGSVSADNNSVHSRKPIAQRFQVISDNTEFVYIINHFKSKGGCNSASGADQDQNDGQGCYNDRRKNQATALLSFINTFGTDANIISMGDYNAYYEEDPIDVLRAGGLNVLNDREDVSFVFFGEGGTLDFAIANDNFQSLISSFESWDINAQEPRSLDYNDFNQPELYQPDPYRSSDHNPVLIGLTTVKTAEFNIAPTNAEQAEGNSGTTSFTFTVTRSSNTDGAAALNFTVTGNGSDPADETDFGGSLPSGTVDFADGETTRVITLNVSGDSDIEANETFQITLSNPTSGSINTATADGTILNDDVTFSITATDADKEEGDSGTTDFSYIVTRMGVVDGGVTVDYTVAGTLPNAANADDFQGATLPAATLTFNSTATTESQVLNIPVNGDTDVENTESFSVTISNPSVGTIETGTANGTIQNDDANATSVTYDIAATDADKVEGNSGTTAFTFTITRGNIFVPSSSSVEYIVSSSGSNASSADDFENDEFPTGTANFGATDDEVTITILVNGDIEPEMDETFIVTLTNPSGNGVINTASANGTIQNDDLAQVTVIVSPSNAVEDETGTFIYTFNRTGPTSSALTVNFSIEGTALASDFDVLSSTGVNYDAGVGTGTILIESGQTSNMLTIDPVEDTQLDGDRTIIVKVEDANL